MSFPNFWPSQAGTASNPPARFPSSSSLSERETQVRELLTAIPDCVETPSGTVFRLPLSLPGQDRDGRKVDLRIEVPLDYPKEAPSFTMPDKPHIEIIDSHTGELTVRLFHPGSTLKACVLNAYEMITGTPYAMPQPPGHPALYALPRAYATPPSSSPAGSSGHTAHPNHSPGIGVEPAHLQTRINQEMSSLDADQLYKLVTDKAAFEALLQKWLGETTMGKRYTSAKLRSSELARENKALYENIQNVEQQLRATAHTELASAQSEHDTYMARQAAAASKIDVESLIKQMRVRVRQLDKGESERSQLEGGAASPEGLSRYQTTKLVDSYMAKMEAYHRADIQATAAERLQQGGGAG